MARFAKLVAFAALLAASPLVHAASASIPFENFMRTALGGGSQTISFSGNGTPVPAIKGTNWGDAPGTHIGNNYFTRLNPGGGVDIGTNGNVPVGKYTVPATLTGSASKAASVAAMRSSFLAIARAGAGPMGLMFALPAFMDWVTDAGVERNPDGSNTSKPFLRDDIQKSCALTPWEQAYLASNPPVQGASRFFWLEAGVCYWKDGAPTCRQYNSCTQIYSKPEDQTVEKVPAAWDELNHKWREANFQPETLPKFIDETEKIRKAHPNAGIEPFKIELDQGQKASGPATLPAPAPTTTTTTKVNPDGSTTTTTTTTTKTPTVTYTGDKIDVAEKDKTTTEEKTCTDTVTCTAPTKPKPDEETDKPAPEETDLCKLHPDILACVKVAKPGELEPTPVPNDVKNLQITPDQGWGPSAGTCPAPKTAQVMGVSLEMPFTMLCDFASAIKPLFIAFAWLSAALTFFGFGRKD